jgi:hypothetical protein
MHHEGLGGFADSAPLLLPPATAILQRMQLRVGLVDAVTGQLVRRVVVVRRDPVSHRLYYRVASSRKFLTPAQTRRCLMGTLPGMVGKCGGRG